MSFKEQERALFDLLFNKVLRERFCSEGLVALTDYGLDPAEQDDFSKIRPDALVLDVDMRVYMILTHICRAFPLSFSLVSSLTAGNDLLKSLVDVKTMRKKPSERATTFGTRLREKLTDIDSVIATEKTLIIAILEAELGMALTSASLKHEILENNEIPDKEHALLRRDWADKPVKLAAYVSAALIPQSYAQLKKALCPCADAHLWKHLSRTPLSNSQRKKVLQQEDPRLLVTRAYVARLSSCEPMVEHKTAELSQGFAHLFQYVNGTNSVEQILAQLKNAGAEEKMLQGVRSGFQQLVETGMLELVDD